MNTSSFARWAILVFGCTCAAIQSQNLNSEQGWMVVADEDTDAVFGFDYSALGIPSAPNGNDTVGLRLRSNITDAGSGAASISVSPEGVDIQGKYRVQFDFWLNIAWSNGTTEAAGGGAGFDSTGSNPQSGIQFIVNSDGDSSSDYRLLNNGQLYGLESEFYTIPSLNNLDNPDLVLQFPGQSPPAVQVADLGQADVTAPDATFSFGWHTMDMLIDTEAQSVTFSIDGFNFGTVSGVNVGGAISITHRDPFGSVNGNADLAFGVYDNLIVTKLSAEAPSFELVGPVVLTDDNAFTNGANLAINTDQPEILITTVDSQNGSQFDDPITGSLAQSALIGIFVDPVTLEARGEPFMILGSPFGGMETHDVKYNPLTKKYYVVVSATNYPPSSRQLPLVAIVNPGDGNIDRAFVYDENGDQSYDDVSIAVSSKNGNFVIAAERNFEGEGEGVVGILFDGAGELLTPSWTKLDRIQPTGDEDDPDVVYLTNNDVFLFLTNTDGDQFDNIITGAVIQTAPDSQGRLAVGEQQILGSRRLNIRQGHPAAIENPFNNQLIGAFDYGNGADGGDLFYFNVGGEPEFKLTGSQTQTPYLVASGNDPYRHRHPQLAADPSSGVIALVYNAHGSPADLANGLAWILLGPDGQVLPGLNENGVYHALTETFDPFEGPAPAIGNDANRYNVKYDPHSDSFISVYTDGSFFTFATKLTVTSDHGGVETKPGGLAVDVLEGAVTIRWDTGTLQATDSLSDSNEWTDVEGASSPYAVDAETGNRFFRLR